MVVLLDPADSSVNYLHYILTLPTLVFRESRSSSDHASFGIGEGGELWTLGLKVDGIALMGA